MDSIVFYQTSILTRIGDIDTSCSPDRCRVAQYYIISDFTTITIPGYTNYCPGSAIKSSTKMNRIVINHSILYTSDRNNP